MEKHSEKQGKQDKQFPIELPSRQNSAESSPIVDDVLDNEIFPLRVDGTNGIRSQSGVHVSTYDDATEVPAIDAVADTENVSSTELFK
ncbi:MAG: hypothetical protein Q4A46_00355 [Clostridia bacterium]|nr:hypothetical protein [Clostridia bacterium]